MDLVVRGRTNGEIASEFGLTLDGVKWHISEILSRFDVDSREQAAQEWRARRGVLSRLKRGVAAIPGALIARYALLGAPLAGVVLVAAAAGLLLVRSAGGPSALAAPVAADAPACGMNDVRWDTVERDATGGAVVVDVTVSYREQHDWPWEYIGIAHQTRCRLDGDLAARIVARSGPDGPPERIDDRVATVPATEIFQATLGDRDNADETVQFTVRWSNWCSPPIPAGLEATFPYPQDGSPEVRGGMYHLLAAVPTCEDGSRPSTLTIEITP